jgi:hypothetical protein
MIRRLLRYASRSERAARDALRRYPSRRYRVDGVDAIQCDYADPTEGNAHAAEMAAAGWWQYNATHYHLNPNDSRVTARYRIRERQEQP